MAFPAVQIFLNNYIVTKINFATNSNAIMVATISFLVNLPVKRVIRMYAMQPIPIPLEME